MNPQRLEYAFIGPVDSEYDSVCSLRFHTLHDLVSGGTAQGRLQTRTVPKLEAYSRRAAHPGPITSVLPAEGRTWSCSADMLSLHRMGGDLVSSRRAIKEGLAMASLASAPAKKQLLVASNPEGAPEGGAPGALSFLAADTAQLQATVAVPCGAKLVELAGSGAAAVANDCGEVHLVEERSAAPLKTLRCPRGKLSTGLAAKGHLLAWCTASVAKEYTQAQVQVYDLRTHGRLHTVYGQEACLARWHPKLGSLLLVADAGGAFRLENLEDRSAPPLPVSHAEAPVTACDISPSGELIALGTADGYLQLWNFFGGRHQGAARVSQVSKRVTAPPIHCPQSSPLGEFEAALETHRGIPLAPDQEAGRPVLEEGHWAPPPRLVHPQVQAKLQQVDFVGYAKNPVPNHRGLAAAESRRLAAPFMNARRKLPQASA